jgi:hypothetical protein
MADTQLGLHSLSYRPLKANFIGIILLFQIDKTNDVLHFNTEFICVPD